MSSGYQVRDILVDRAETCRLRVLDIEPDRTWLFNIDERLGWPFWRGTAELRVEVQAEHYKAGRAEKRGLIGKKAEDRAALKKARFALALNPLSRLYTPRGRGLAFAELKRGYPKLTRRTFDQAVRDWCAGGMSTLAFAPDWDKCGIKAIDTKQLDSIDFAVAKAHALERACAIDLAATPLAEVLIDHTAAGARRKRKAPAAPARYIVDRLTLRVFMHFYAWKLAETGRSLTDARVEMDNEVFSVEGADGVRRLLPAGQLPSDRQFANWYYELIGHKDRRTGTVGEKTFNLEERALLGNEISKTVKVGAHSSGDATIWNISILSRFAGKRVVGCPVVFRIRCKRSGMLLGLAVTLESASWIGMAAAVANCLQDKVAYCASIGLKISPDEWPVCGLPAELEVDRGETDNHHPTRLTKVTSVSVKNLPPGRPEIKPGIESDWNTLQVRMNGKTPAALILTWEKAQSIEWKLAAEIDIDQFTRLLVRHELDRMKKPRKSVPLDDRMIAAGISTSPLSMWNYSVEREGGGLLSYTEDEVKLALLQRDKPASITPRGVMFQGCYYLNDELLRRHAFSAARTGGHKPVDVAYDPRLVNHIYLERINGQELDVPLVCYLSMELEHQRPYVGKCFAEVRELQARESINASAAKAEYRQCESETRTEHKAIVAEGKAMTAAAPSEDKSKNQLLKEIPVNRKEERYAHSPTQALTPFVGQTAATSRPPPAGPGPTTRPAPTPAPAPASTVPAPAAASSPQTSPSLPQSRQAADAAAFLALLNRTQTSPSRSF